MWMTHIWLPKMMDSATHAIWESDPSFVFFFLSFPSSYIPNPLPQLSRIISVQLLHPPSPVAPITSFFLLLWLLLFVWGHGAAAQPQTLSSVVWETIEAMLSTPDTLIFTLNIYLCYFSFLCHFAVELLRCNNAFQRIASQTFWWIYLWCARSLDEVFIDIVHCMPIVGWRSTTWVQLCHCFRWWDRFFFSWVSAGVWDRVKSSCLYQHGSACAY